MFKSLWKMGEKRTFSVHRTPSSIDRTSRSLLTFKWRQRIDGSFWIDNCFVKCCAEPQWIHFKSSFSGWVNLKKIRKSCTCPMGIYSKSTWAFRSYRWRHAKILWSVWGILWGLSCTTECWERGKSIDMSKKGSVAVEACPHSLHLRSDCSFPVNILWIMQRQYSVVPPQCWWMPFAMEMKNSWASCCSYSASLSLYLHTAYKKWCGV